MIHVLKSLKLISIIKQTQFNGFSKVFQLDLYPHPNPVKHLDLIVTNSNDISAVFIQLPIFLTFNTDRLKLNKSFQAELRNQHRKTGALNSRNDSLFFELFIFEKQI